MTAATLVRRLVGVLRTEPAFPDYRAGFMYLAAADEARARSGCSCRNVVHALTLPEQASVADALQVARDQGRGELADYLATRLEPCTTRGVTVDALFEMDRPAAPARSEDYESWMSAVRPAFEAAALTGAEFTTHEVATAASLPEPPDPAHHWGRLMTLLHDEQVIRPAGWAHSSRRTSHASGVRTWVGVTTRIRGAA